MYGFLRRPKWVIGTACAVLGVVVFAACGAWQWSRHNEVRAFNALLEQRLEAAPRPLADLVADVGPEADALAYRRVTVDGAYRPDDEVLLSTRSYQGRPGHHLLTPLALAGPAAGTVDAIVVDRGWVPLELDRPPVAQAAPPSGQTTVTGILFPSEPATAFGPRVAVDGRADYLGGVDVDRLQQQVDADLAEVYVLAQAESGAQGAEPGAGALTLPIPADPPALDPGNHFSYTVQWLLFATVVGVGWPVLVRRTARDRAAAQSEEAPTDPPVRPFPRDGAVVTTPVDL